MDESQEIFDRHQSIGFPILSENDQFNLIFKYDLSIINNLTPDFRANHIPTEVAKKYITISKSRFTELFRQSGYIERLNEEHSKHPLRDGEWIEELENGLFELYIQERGVIVDGRSFSNYDQVVNHYVDGFFRRLGLDLNE